MSTDNKPIILEITSCRGCPHLDIQHVSNWQLGPHGGYSYTCLKDRRSIYPKDGVTPPPSWCPIREENKPPPPIPKEHKCNICRGRSSYYDVLKRKTVDCNCCKGTGLKEKYRDT